MSRTADFVLYLQESDYKTEVELASVVAWYLIEASNKSFVDVSEIVEFLSEWSLRPNINKSRLKNNLKKFKDISCKSSGEVRVPVAISKVFKEQFGEFLEEPKFEPDYSLLSADVLEGHSSLLESLNEQLNANYELEYYDCVAVLMRRIMECLLIRAFNKSGCRKEIHDGKTYSGLESIISRVSKTNGFHLSRGSDRIMLSIKKIGDKGAHSTSYSISKQDVLELSLDFRSLITELANL